MKKFLFVCFLSITANSFSREGDLDSLIRQLNQCKQEDTVKLNLMAKIGNLYSDIDPEKGLEMAEKAIILSRKLKNEKKLGLSYAVKGFNFAGMGDNEKAVEMYLLSLNVQEKLNNKPAIGSMSHNIGNAYFNLSQYNKAATYYEKSMQVFEELGDSNSLAAVMNGLGTTYEYQSNYTKALDYYLKSLHIYENMGDKAGNDIANVYINLGILYRDLSLFKKSLDYYNKALAIHETLENKSGIANTLNNIGNLYDDADSADKAIEIYNRALEINKSLGNDDGIANNLTNLGVIYVAGKNYSLAWDYLQQSLVQYKYTGDKSSMCVVLNELGKICSNAPDSFLLKRNVAPSKRFDKALEYQINSLRLSQEIEAVNMQVFAYEALIKTYEAKNDIRKAFEASKQYIHLHDSILSDENKSEISKKEAQFEFDKKESLLKSEHEKKQALAAAEINKQRVIKNGAMGGGTILMLAGAFSFIFYKRKRDAEKEKAESDFKAQVSDTEMKALRAQMNPHFIFNSLNSIGDFISRNDIKTADVYLSRFAKVMRMILENSEKKEVSIEDDLKALELYMQLESIRLNGKFAYEITVDTDIDKENTLIPPLILQPFVENSIWHGISKKDGAGKITIRIKKEGDMINCIVEDNGIGRKKSEAGKSASSQSEKKSLGMKITNARIDIINRIKKSKASVELSDLSEGFRVEVKLPLELSF